MNHDILSTIGKTPLLGIDLDGEKIYAKAGFMNPSGSVKDRMANHMVKKAEEEGVLTSNKTIIEVTAGNTGTSLAMVAAVKDYSFIALMPKKIGTTKKKFIKSFGGKIREVGSEDFSEARQIAEEMNQQDKYWYSWQTSNPHNPAAMEEIGAEIAREMEQIDSFVAGVGTGGTLIGAGRALQRKFSRVKLYAVEPTESPILSEGKYSFHQIEGIAESCVPDIFNRNEDLVQEILQIKSKEAIKMAKRLSREKGLPVGVSSGANVLAALRIAKKGGRIVTVLPDRRDRYPDLLF